MAAAQTLHALLKRDPRHAAAHMTLGHIAWSRGRVRESAHHVLHVAGNPPSDPRAVIWTLWLASFAGASLRASPTSAMPVARYACNFGWREAALSSGVRDSREPSSPQLPCGLVRNRDRALGEWQP